MEDRLHCLTNDGVETITNCRSLIAMTYLQLGAEHQNLRLYYELHGTGRIKIVFIMGLLADGASWIHQVDSTWATVEMFAVVSLDGVLSSEIRLSSRSFRSHRKAMKVASFSVFQCVSYDNRGSNRSSAPVTRHYTTIQMAKDALALIDHLQWSRCHVVGISMGGMIALELALLAPLRILSLSLLATHAGGFAVRAPMSGVRHILRSMIIRDRHHLIENAMSMLYAGKTLINPTKRQVCHFVRADEDR